jgi:phospholipid/cholesterol/gamma-HCH transport system permease protein
MGEDGSRVDEATRHLELREAAGELTVELGGPWTTAAGLPDPSEMSRRLAAQPPLQRLRFEAQRLTRWDSSLLVFVERILGDAERAGVEVDASGLPEGVRRLHRLANAVAGRTDTGAGKAAGWLARVGAQAISLAAGVREAATFVGEVTLGFARLLVGRARFRATDLITALADCGPRALPIVSLISFLTGMILAFVGSIQLSAFGAQIFVANLVAIGMAVEMGALMTGIIMAGRAGAAFAAQIGTMQVNEEIDALRTTGLSPIDFLVVPRTLSLFIMTPLLSLYAVFIGILGGAVVGTLMLDLSWTGYIAQTQSVLNLTFFAKGLIKAAVFGVLIGMAGCMRGMQCGRSAQAVGVVTTSAVVTSLVLIVVADATLTVIYDAIKW